VLGVREDSTVFPRVSGASFHAVRGDRVHRVKEDLRRQTHESVGPAAQAHSVRSVSSVSMSCQGWVFLPVWNSQPPLKQPFTGFSRLLECPGFFY